MATTEAAFSLRDANVAVFREISDFYDLDVSWLTSHFEQYVSEKGIAPFGISTQSYHSQHGINGGVDEVTFKISFCQVNPNYIECIRFHEMPADKHFIVTETSMMHTRQSTGCCLWFEVPRGALEEDNGGIFRSVTNAMKINICCDGWKAAIPIFPGTDLERTHLFLRLRAQINHRESVLYRIRSEVAYRRIEMDKLKKANAELLRERDALQAEIEDTQSWIESRTAVFEESLEKHKELVQKLRAELADMKAMPDESDCPTPRATPASRAAQGAGAEGHLTTPAKKGSPSM